MEREMTTDFGRLANVIDPVNLDSVPEGIEDVGLDLSPDRAFILPRDLEPYRKNIVFFGSGDPSEQWSINESVIDLLEGGEMLIEDPTRMLLAISIFEEYLNKYYWIIDNFKTRDERKSARANMEKSSNGKKDGPSYYWERNKLKINKISEVISNFDVIRPFLRKYIQLWYKGLGIEDLNIDKSTCDRILAETKVIWDGESNNEFDIAEKVSYVKKEIIPRVIFVLKLLELKLLAISKQKEINDIDVKEIPIYLRDIFYVIKSELQKENSAHSNSEEDK